MLSHDEAQELHLIIGAVIQDLDDEGFEEPELERALELAAILVSDTDPENTESPDYRPPAGYIWDDFREEWASGVDADLTDDEFLESYGFQREGI
jgi:hypothetical protein